MRICSKIKVRCHALLMKLQQIADCEYCYYILKCNSIKCKGRNPLQQAATSWLAACFYFNSPAAYMRRNSFLSNLPTLVFGICGTGTK